MGDGIRIVVEAGGLVPAMAALGRIAGRDTAELMTDIGAVLESHIRERIGETKRAPDGSAWAPNRAGTSILRRTGLNLLDSIAFIAGADEVEAGSSWEFAHIHQGGATIKPKNGEFLAFSVPGKGGGAKGAKGGKGGKGAAQTVFAKEVTIPARPFVGWSAEDEAEAMRLATDWLGVAEGWR